MRRTARGIFMLAVTVGMLWLLFRGTNWEEFRTALLGVSWRWLLASQILAWATYFMRTRRWAYVVRAVQPASFRQLFSATQIGFLVNFTVPARIGELVRAYLLSRFTGQSLSRSISMVAVDRVNDFIGLLSVMAVAALAYDVDRDVNIVAGAFGNAQPIGVSSAVIRPATLAVLGLLIAAAASLVILYRRQSLIIRLSSTVLGRISTGLAERLARIVEGFAEGLHIFRSGHDVAWAVFWSLMTWGASAMSLACTMLAFGLPSPFAASFLMLTFIAVFISVPLAPGMVGQYHLPVVAALLLSYPGIDPAHAKALAVVSHFSALIPVACLGLYCLRRESISLLDVIKQSDSAARQNA